MQFQVLKYFKLQSISVHANSRGTRTPAREPFGVVLLPLRLLFAPCRRFCPSPLLFALNCHPELIRAKRGWVRDLLLLLPLRVPDPSKCKGRSFDVAFRRRRSPPASRRHPEERSDEGSLLVPALRTSGTVPLKNKSAAEQIPQRFEFSSFELPASRPSKYHTKGRVDGAQLTEKSHGQTGRNKTCFLQNYCNPLWYRANLKQPNGWPGYN
jgi:hypothetical protein